MPANLHAENFFVHDIKRKKRSRSFQQISLSFQVSANDRLAAKSLP
jgi:hypothetical protein